MAIDPLKETARAFLARKRAAQEHHAEQMA